MNNESNELTYTRLDELDFRRSTMRACRFTHADLRESDFTHADLRKATFEGAVFTAASVREITIPGGYAPDAELEENGVQTFEELEEYVAKLHLDNAVLRNRVAHMGDDAKDALALSTDEDVRAALLAIITEAGL